MRRKFLCLAVSVLASPAFSAPPELPQNADAKAAKFFNDYYTAYAGNDYDRMASYYDSDAVFEDPTSDSFIRGAEKLRKAMDLLDDFRDLHWRFHQIVREGDTYAAQATLTGTAYGTKFATRFATIVTFKNDKLIRHVDFLDNRPIAAASQGVASESLWEGRKLGDVAGKFAGRSKKGEAYAVARKYIDALEHADGEAAGALYDEAAIFEDPTFHLLLRGRSEIEDYAKAAFPNYEYVQIRPDALISNADGAVIEGTGFAVSGGFQTSMRFMTFLRVTDGRITSQADFYDYGEYARLTRARAT